MSENINTVEWFLSETGNSVEDFRNRVYSDRARIGQAFFNSLSDEQKGILSGSLVDPFRKDSYHEIIPAIEFLIDKS